ncbi:hypothetical protein [Anaerotruncus colihominis]|uniref:hypothetical protein n=1 Tax=Anaerotruncus colihominis TaxID=169435 RepID=UPI0026EA5D41|nr:hypothetical protein [Anaerotruncus colihominis]
MIKLNSSILRRLALLQHIADKNKPAQVVIRFTNGTATVTTPGEAMDAFRARGQSGEIVGFSSDNSTFAQWAQLLTVLLHPLANREVSDFE